MDSNRYMIDTAGGVHRVPLYIVAEKEALDWYVLPQSQVDSHGEPKQWYYPQYDRNQRAYQPPAPEADLANTVGKILPVEVF